jgi:tRNA threonylcarbamoyladenosine biosynthesis protein TsaE
MSQNQSAVSGPSLNASGGICATIKLVMEPETTTVKGLENLAAWAAEFAQKIQPKKDQATVVGLVGPLGVGKTAFVQSLLEIYGVEKPVTSPTYTIESVYDLPDGPFSRGYHIDVYRLDGAADLGALHFSDRLTDPENLILLEWAGRVSELLPPETFYIDIAFGDTAGERVITTSYE